jgi:photosystem II PsbZ protein
MDLTFIYQLLLLAFVGWSFALVVSFPVTLASPEGWVHSKQQVFVNVTIWFLLLFLAGIFSAYV